MRNLSDTQLPAIPLAKMADVATGTVFYRKTAAAGIPETQTLATLKTDLGLTGTNSGDQTSIAGITGTKAEFDTAVTDGNIVFVSDIGTSVQAYDADLSTIAGLIATTDNFIVSTASAWSSRTPAQVRTTLGLVIGTNVQAYDVDLTTWSGITPGTGVGTALAVAVGSAGAFTTFNGAGGTPSSLTLTNATGLPISGLTASTVTALGVGSIELGHAIDTTLARSSAGNVTIEGNLIYRAGGTDVPLTDGGTGASDAATARANLAAAGSGAVTASGLTQSTARILGRTTAATGAIEEIAVGTGLSLSGGSLTSTASATPVDIQDFTASGTWTKPSGSPKLVEVIMWGGGGGGGGGLGAGNAYGGGGGGGAAYAICNFLPADLSATETVTIGAGGSGGSGAAGSTGTAGGDTVFGSRLTTRGGLGGAGGSGSAEGALSSNGMFPGAHGGKGGIFSGIAAKGGNVTNLTTPIVFSPCPGGGGGGFGDGSNGGDGGEGSLQNVEAVDGGGGGGGTGGSPPAAGTSGAARSGCRPGTGGGGGGGRSGSGLGGNGGTGGTNSGAGGGGGGGTPSSTQGANGGNGGSGFCRVITYF